MSYIIPAGESDPAPIYNRLRDTCAEFAHIKEGEPIVAFLLKEAPTIRQGRQILGTVFEPMVQGQLRPLFDWMLSHLFDQYPDFLIILDLDWWEAANEREREILVFHEMCHIAQAEDGDGVPKFNKVTGAPCWCLRGHSIEEFHETVRRYGAYSLDLEEFKQSFISHETSC